MKSCLFAISLLCFLHGMAQKNTGYGLNHTFHITSDGWWDYLSVYGNELYVSHGTQVNILNKTTGDSLGVIGNTTGVHGITFDPASGKGFTSNGRTNDVTVFLLKTKDTLGRIPAGENPDAILFDGFSGKLVTCNGRSNDLTVIDPVTRQKVATIPVGGKPETLVSDGNGKWFVNIEDKNEIALVDARTYSVQAHWSLGQAESPTGLAYDPITHQLFAGCEKKLVVMDALTGKVNATLPIGDGCDGVAFDEQSRLIFTSNGEGTMTILKVEKNGKTKIVDTIPTKKGARTLAIDPETHLIYLPTADFEPMASGEKGRPKMKSGSFQILVYGN